MNDSPIAGLRDTEAINMVNPPWATEAVTIDSGGESRGRSLAKSLSWRFIATLITISVAWSITGSIAVSAGIGVADSLVKFIVYYGHERAWLRIRRS